MPSTPAPLEARPGTPRAEFLTQLGDRLWRDDDPRWSELGDALMFVEDRSSEAGEYYAYRAAAAATWRIVENLATAFNVAGAGGDTIRNHQSAQMAAYAVITRELDTIAEHMRALLEDVAHQVAPVEDDYRTAAGR